MHSFEGSYGPSKDTCIVMQLIDCNKLEVFEKAIKQLLVRYVYTKEASNSLSPILLVGKYGRV